MRVWRRNTGLAAALAPVLAVMAVLLGCDDPGAQDPAKDVPGIIENLEIIGWGHTELLIRWEEPVLGSPRIDGYNVYFHVGGGSNRVLIGTPSGTSLTHDPYDSEEGGWVTGTYSVRAYNDEGEGEPSYQSTIPVHSACYLYELDFDLLYAPALAAGLHFNRTDGTTTAIPVNYTYSSRNAELYLTDLAAGCCGSQGFYLCSMAYGSYESLDKDRIDDFSGQLEDCKFFDTATAEYFPLVVNGVLGGGYRSNIPLNENYFSVHTSDDHYAVIRVGGDIELNGDPILLDCWFQKIPSFGVLAH